MSHSSVIDQVETWLRDSALPLWLDRGIDIHAGGFVEALTQTGADAGVPFKRLRVSCRQTYVFAHATVLEYVDARDAIEHGFQFITEAAWQGPEGGFARRLRRDGTVLDGTADLYDHAFVLFSMAWGFAATQEQKYRIWAHKTLDTIEALLGDYSTSGYWHDERRQGWRTQNPHMHLLEASLAAFEHLSEDRFRNLALELLELFSTRLYDPVEGIVREFFDEAWSAAPAPHGNKLEPGHHFEWVWILHQVERLTGVGSVDAMRSLADFATRAGVDPVDGKVLNMVSPDGEPIDSCSRTWPNTERLKAAVALWERFGTDPTPTINQAGTLLLKRYLNTEVRGLWIDSLDKTGEATTGLVPASTFYHLFLAFSEIRRIYAQNEIGSTSP